MQLRRHKDIIAIKNGENAPIAFHARNLEVAEVSNEAWASMAPTTFDNGFLMNMLPQEGGVIADALGDLEAWNSQNNPEVITLKPSMTIDKLTINVTQLCNLHCTYCAAGGDGTYGDPVTRISVEKTFPQIKLFLNKLEAGSFFSVTFIGGEPLLYPDAIKAIASYANEMASLTQIKTAFTVITNGTLVNDKALKILMDIKCNIVLSLDGPPEIHDLARPQKNGKGSGELAVSGLEKLLHQKSNLGSITIHAVFSRNNLFVEEAYEFFKRFDANSFEFTFDITESDPEINRKFLEGMSRVADRAYSEGGEEALRKIILFDRYFEALDEQTRTENHCGSGKSLLSIDAKNKIYACPLDVGNKSLQVGEGDQIDANQIKELQDPFIKKNNCDTCWARFLCGGGCLFAHKTATGNKHKKHYSYCERSRYLIGMAIFYYYESRTS